MDLFNVTDISKMSNQITLYRNRANRNNFLNIEYAGITPPTKNYRFTPSSSLRYNNFEYIKSGTMCIETGEHKYMAFAGDIYILKQGISTTYYSVGDQKLEKIYFSARGELINGLFNIYGLTDDVIIASCNTEDLMLKIHNELMSNIDLPNVTYNISLYIYEIIMKIAIAKNKADFSFDPGYALEDQFKSFVDSGLNFDYTIKKFAIQFGTTEPELIRLFKNKYGITPYAYFMKKRLETGANFLKNTKLTVNEIALKLCFANGSCFSKAFKNHYGVYPTEYRHNLHK